MKKQITHKIYQYTAIFEPDEKSGGFTVTIPSLPGCISEGDSFEEALQNIQEAASLYKEATGFISKASSELQCLIIIKI